MAVAASALMNAGMESVEEHESSLTAYALDHLRSLPEITIYGETDHRRGQDRVGVISFNLGSAPHALVAAILGYEGGIGVRNGCFCAQQYVMRLLGLTETQQSGRLREVRAGDKSQRPGMVRVSFGAYNTSEDVDALVEMLHRITRHEYKGEYHQNTENGEYIPSGYQDSIADYFSFNGQSVSSFSGDCLRETEDICLALDPSPVENRI